MDAMLTTYGFTANNVHSVMNTEGLNDPDLLVTIEPDDVGKMCAGLSKLSAARGGFFIGLLKQKNLEALVWWANDRVAQNQTLDPIEWTPIAMQHAKANMRVEEESSEDTISSSIPTSFTSDDWSDDHFLFVQHVKQSMSSDGKRDLSYVIRVDTTYCSNDDTS